MSALSVMSLIAPTAPVGANAETVDTAADGALFAGLVAAVAPSLKGTGEDGAPVAAATPAETDAAGTPALDIAVEAAPAWAPVPLIAPAPLPVAPATPAAPVAEGAPPAPTGAPAVAPTPPITPAPLLDTAPAAPLANAPTTAPAGDVRSKAAAALPISGAVPSSDTPQQTLDAVKAPAAPAVSAPPESASVEVRPVQAMAQPAAAAPQPVAQQSTAPSVEGLPPTGQPTRQAAASARPADATAPASPIASATTAVADDATALPHAEAVPVARAAAPAPMSVVMTASSIPAAPTTATTTRPATETAPAQPLAAEPVVPATPTAGAEASAPVAAPASRPTAPVAPHPVVPSTSQPARPAPSDDTADTVKTAAAPVVASSEPETEVAPQTPPPTIAAPAPAPAPARNGSARLDERRSNAATASAPAEARGDASTGARSILPTSTPSVAVPATTAALSDTAAPAPLATADAAPLDAQPDLAPAQPLLDAQTAAPTAHRDLGLSQLSRATVETTAQLAAQIIRKLEGRSTRFDMALTPEGLGRVDVSLEIDSDGRLAARLAFDNPAAATDMRARADELRRQLQDAGFQLTQDSLEFSDRNPSSSFGGGGAFDRAPDRRAFAGAARLAAEADTALPAPGAWASLSQTRDRVDLKV